MSDPERQPKGSPALAEVPLGWTLSASSMQEMDVQLRDRDVDSRTFVNNGAAQSATVRKNHAADVGPAQSHSSSLRKSRRS
jgi:hypothetical protein